MNIIRNVLRNFLIGALWLLIARGSWAAVYSVSSTDGGADYASIQALDTAFSASTFSSGDTIEIDECVQWTRNEDILKLRSQANFSDSNHVTIKTYNSGCGESKPDAMWAITTGLTLDWSVASGSIYGASVTDYTGLNTVYGRIPNILFEDGVLLNAVLWDTDIATTAASMSAGTFTYDYDAWQTGTLYVWSRNGASPATHTMTFGSRNCVVCCNMSEFGSPRQDNCGGITLDGLSVKWSNFYPFQFGGILNDTASHGVTLKNITCSESTTCAGISGNGATYQNVTANDMVEYKAFIVAGARAALARFWLNSALTGWNIDGLYSYGGRGSGLEVNYGSSNGYAKNVNIYDGHESCAQVYELANNNVFDDIHCETDVSDPSSFGFIFSGDPTLGSDNNIVRNSTFIGTTQVCARFQATSTGNIFENNTCVSDNAGWSVAGAYQYANATNNIVRNNVFISRQSTAEKFIDDEDGELVLNNNLYYQSIGGFTADYNNVNYTSFLAYQSATGQDENSKNEDPLLASNYRPLVTSATVDAGMSISGMETLLDGDGNQRVVNILDIGAYEYQIPDPDPDPTPGGNGKVQLRGFRGRIRIH